MSSKKNPPPQVQVQSKTPAIPVGVNPFISSEIQALQQDRAALKSHIKDLAETTPGVEALEAKISADTALIATLKHNGVAPPASSGSGESKQLAAEVNKVNDILNHPVVAPTPSTSQVAADTAEEAKAMALEAAEKRLLRDELAREAAAGITLQHAKPSASEKAAEAAALTAEQAALASTVGSTSNGQPVTVPTPAETLPPTTVTAVVPVPQGVTASAPGAGGSPAVEAVYFYQTPTAGPIRAVVVTPYVPATSTTPAVPASYSVTIGATTYPAEYHTDTDTYTVTTPNPLLGGTSVVTTLTQFSQYVPAVTASAPGSTLPNVGTNYATPLSNYWFAHYHNATRRVSDIVTSADNQLVIDSGAGLQFVPRTTLKGTATPSSAAVRPAPLDRGIVLGPHTLPPFDPIVAASGTTPATTNPYGVNVTPPQVVFGTNTPAPVTQIFKVDETEIAVLHPGVYRVSYEVYTHSPDARFGVFVKQWVDPSTLPGPGEKVDPFSPVGKPALVDGSVGYFHGGLVRAEVLVECRTFDKLILVNMGKEAVRLDNFSLYGRPNATFIIHNITPLGAPHQLLG
jgi:hypothetical protein